MTENDYRNQLNITTFTTTVVTPTDLTYDQDSDESSNKWKFLQFIEIEQDGTKMVDFVSAGDRLFVIFSNLLFFEISLKSGKIIQEIDLKDLDGIECQAEDQIQAFAIF